MTISNQTADTAADCHWYERHGLDSETAQVEQHIASCAACQVTHREFERLRDGLAGLGRGDAGQSDWEARVWAQIARQQTPMWRRVAFIVLPLAAATSLLLLARGHLSSELGSSMVHEDVVDDARTVRRGDTVSVSASVTPSDRAALRVYDGAGDLVRRCDQPLSCRREPAVISLRVTLEQPGSYRVVVLTTNQAIPATEGTFDADLAMLRARGIDMRVVETLQVE